MDLTHLLRTRPLRVSGHFVLTLVDRLERTEQQRLAPLRRDPGFYGVIRRDDGRGELAASREVALLLLTLERSPGPLPEYLRAEQGSDVFRVLERLVLDGVLEVESDAGYVSGTAAVEAARDGTPHPLAALNLDALVRLAQHGIVDRDEAGGYLYHFNRVPVAAAGSARLGNRSALREFIGMYTGESSRLLGTEWRESASTEADGWIYWRNRADSNTRDAAGVTHKLYVSTVIEDLPEAFARVVTLMTDLRAPSFKIGASAHAVARPDKLVCYFSSPRAAAEASTILAESMRDLRAHGVPFTAPVDATGLVSAGQDQPDRIGGHGQVSWRQWVCRRLAKYVIDARLDGAEAAHAATFALRRLASDGVDAKTWLPVAGGVA